MRDEALRRGQAPFLLPSAVLKDGTPSPSALAALRKRTLYPPTKWAEELDDSKSVRGLLTVTFAGSFPGGGWAVLLLRAKRGKDVPVDATYGPLHPLGHNPQVRGWQPFVLPLGTLLTPDLTITLNIDAPLSRCLLGRGGTGGNLPPGGL
ncbi:hypothetical protein [Deinococcus hopiensis]|uniref:Uncharacterized protein n=1 Tax=Deinococcus hopiensis KR-140 TaxID=695939 RepID=A0A1W1VJX9_9DEIO|nr:hypothetical protein [Deinococcus hopiensis]SMB93244.1 hypothetical protein SAMN00790413_01903 [Deinococcus hopiensis KR-140]